MFRVRGSVLALLLLAFSCVGLFHSETANAGFRWPWKKSAAQCAQEYEELTKTKAREYDELAKNWNRFSSVVPDAHLNTKFPFNDHSHQAFTIADQKFYTAGTFVEPNIGEVVVVRPVPKPKSDDTYGFDGSVKNLDSIPESIKETLGYTVIGRPGVPLDHEADRVLGGALELRMPTAATMNERLDLYNSTAKPGAKIEIRFFQIKDKEAIIPHERMIDEYVKGRFPLRLLHEHLVHVPTLVRTPPELIKRHMAVVDRSHKFLSWLKSNNPRLVKDHPELIEATILRISEDIDGRTAIFESFVGDYGSIADRTIKLLKDTRAVGKAPTEAWRDAIMKYGEFLKSNPLDNEVPEGHRSYDEIKGLYRIRNRELDADRLPRPSII